MNTHNPIMAALLAEETIDPKFRSTLSDVLADSGSRTIPWLYVTTREGEEIERLSLGDTTTRQHARRAQTYTRLAHEFEFGDDDEIVAAVTLNEITGIER